MGEYAFKFTEQGPYGAAVRLLEGSDLRGKVVLDVGCGAAAMAAPVRALGATYVGLDVDADAVFKLVELGFEGHTADLTSPELTGTVRDVVAGRPVAALLCLDVLEHVPDPAAVLGAFTDALGSQQDVELVVSIPNVGHVDLARQLLCGRWNMTDTGLLDRTHLRFFTDRSVTELMSSAGWYEGAREDFPLAESDQHVAQHPAFGTETNLGALIGAVRSRVDGYGTVNQFVRRYHRGAPRQPEAAATAHRFLSVVVRTTGTRKQTLTEVLCCLAAQTDLDFEVVLVVHDLSKKDEVRRLVDEFESNLSHRVRVIGCDGGGRGRPANLGLREATGDYVVFLDDDDLVTANWVEAIHRGAEAHPGMVVRGWAAEQNRRWAAREELADHAASGPLLPTYTTAFDLVGHIRQNRTPFHCFAFPRALVSLGFSFDETLTVCEDWHFLIRAASLCGVHDTGKLTSIYNRWSKDSSSHSVDSDEWNVMRSFIHVALDEQPLLLPPGSVRQLDKTLAAREEDQRTIGALRAELAAVRAQLDALAQVSNNAHAAIGELRDSASWKASAPLRVAGRTGRKLADRLRER
ncbi:glycosyltransferase [Amycolatopsis minnesotensis]|uniref:Methyltransferase domain-containing protein n=1 Tax=Amycolatopsis minnesotensis TaxID=337894 RepID=A0ABN2RDL6_9PSEU